MDRQIKSEQAWMIPYEVCKYFNAFSIDELVATNEMIIYKAREI
jgi:hypothetical protein